MPNLRAKALEAYEASKAAQETAWVTRAWDECLANILVDVDGKPVAKITDLDTVYLDPGNKLVVFKDRSTGLQFAATQVGDDWTTYLTHEDNGRWVRGPAFHTLAELGQILAAGE